MAIKGKSKAKSRPKQVARAPRREPVTVKPPIPQRRWVQAVAAFIVGLFAMMVLVWVTNGLRQNDADDQAANAAAQRRAAATSWRNEVETVIGKVAVLTPGVAPTVLDDMSQAMDALRKGDVPKDAEATFKTAQEDAQTAVDALSGFDLSAAIADHGLTPIQALAFADSKDRMVAALGLYRQAAAVAEQAAGATGTSKIALTKIAIDLRDTAVTQFQLAWSRYTEALSAGGIIDQGAGATIPGLGSSSG